MELREGYKNTEVGIIPVDWNEAIISDVAKVRGGGTPSTFIKDYWEGDINWFTPTEIGFTKYVSKSERRITKAGLDKSSAQLLPIGAILLTTRASIGDLAILLDESSTNQGFQSLIPLNNVSNELIYYELISRKRHLLRLASGSTFLEVSPKKVKSFKIPLPPTLNEQQAIATALSDIDILITSFDRLIVKKKAIKQGTMQQLLKAPDKRGKRLPGFKGEWVNTTIGQIARISTGSKNTQDRVDDGKYPFFVRSQIVERINTYSFEGEGILTAGDGVGTGKVFHYVNERIDIHQRVYLISDFKPSIDGYFLFLIFKENFYNRIMSMTAKSSVDSVRKEMITGMSISVPPTKEEQQEIASILLDMDKEIETLESKKSKYLLIKQGMMQELLTGKTRLI